MSIELRVTTTLMRLALKRRLNANYCPIDGRRRLTSHRLTRPPVDFGDSVLEPRGDTGAAHTIVYVPGGGFMLGADDRHRRFVDVLCRRTGSRGWILHYPLAPENPYPAARDDTVHALRQVLSAPDTGAVTLVADSAGAALALSATLALDTPRGFDSLVLLSPLTDLATTGLSYVYNRYRDPLCGPEAVIHKVHHYLRGANPTDPIASPLWGDLHGLPPLQIFVGSTEIMLDDSVRLAEKARAAGCDVELRVVAKAPHTFPLLVPWCAESRRAVDAMTAFITEKGNHR
ncbi:alpha/beta hydrolase [[Mycobacterium] wendilense]|uniref:Alpha/beta hydrolase fold domain-containing protein n=1 Tax=[Mycobacterium] wendilense TaxID=3064284 RepID=A0ABM9M8P2_9MYCO|nr:alpha/beta hydrolase fold domain-containing protein [Mycolicibacterium sp. MU0050]CAJ1579115.1 alpha/beta hydrolase fold domain-containing protein [Mycolicibacterium sp. MU0050]